MNDELKEFYETFEKFQETYQECTTLITTGIDVETTDESKVSRA